MQKRPTRLLLLLPVVTVLSGCNPAGFFDLIDSLSGGKKQTVVLLNAPLVINDQPRTFIAD
ncbi:MAG: hypothetical protein JNM76_09690 [Betaproteobacteria bacterium]|nr:hypothetical protein [Betaproteobacteria bacterium]